jgi:hypothetical protein
MKLRHRSHFCWSVFFYDFLSNPLEIFGIVVLIVIIRQKCNAEYAVCFKFSQPSRGGRAGQVHLPGVGRDHAEVVYKAERRRGPRGQEGKNKPCTTGKKQIVTH